MPFTNWSKLSNPKAASGVVSRTLTNFIDRVKIAKQINLYNSTQLSTIQTLKVLKLNEGWSFLMRGNMANLMTGVPFIAFQFYFYELFIHVF